MQVSKHIENFLDFYRQALSDYTYAQQQVSKCQNYTQDILHSLELDNLSYAERCKLMTKLMHCRQDRRYWKDQVEELEPIVSIFVTSDASKRQETDRNNKVLNLLREALGQTRRQENYHKDRKYTPRIFKREEAEQ